MATRHQARIAIVGILYARDFNEINDDFIQEYLEDKKIRNEQKNFALELYKGVLANIENINEILKNNLKEFDKLSHIELAILRISVYELYYSQTQKAIIINEAVELAKELAHDNSSKLINAVLDSIKD